MAHIPVLLNEVLEALDLWPGKFVIDATVGGGSHAKRIIEKLAPNGRFLGIDWDVQAIEKLRGELPGDRGLKRFVLTIANYSNLPVILEKEKLGKANGLLIDLGFSSEQLKNGRGFSFSEEGGEEPLIMTYNAETLPAYKVLRQLRKDELERIIKELSDERYARRIAAAIWERERKNPIETNKDLVETVASVVPRGYEGGRLNPATRTFQALRIFVNDELGNLKSVLENLNEIVAPGGRVAIISYHSGEDRIVKNRFRELARADKAELLTKKPIRATEEEIIANSNSRSAKLRVIRLVNST